jgi:Uma2 family endonuclease
VLTKKWTTDEYHRLIETGILEGCHVELIEGEIVEMAPEGEIHADNSDFAARYLERILGERAIVRRAKPILLPNGSEPEPDLAIVRPQRYRSQHPTPKEIFWLIEYSNSSLEYDTEVKTRIYATANIGEYWIVNLQKLHLLVYRRPVNASGDYLEQEERHEPDSISPIFFPNLKFSVNRIING